MNELTLEMIKKLAEQKGYRFKESIENNKLVVEMFRPDGSRAMIATKEINAHIRTDKL